LPLYLPLSCELSSSSTDDFASGRNIIVYLYIRRSLFVRLFEQVTRGVTCVNKSRERVGSAYNLAHRTSGGHAKRGLHCWIVSIANLRPNTEELVGGGEKYCKGTKEWDVSSAGIFKQTMGARNRLGIGCCTGPPDYIGWRNWFLGIDS
jgi:hypothetical protein